MGTELSRAFDWPVRLERFLDENRASAFSWNGGDCVVGWAADAVLAMTDVDLAAASRGKYKTERGAIRVMIKAGFDNLADLIGSMLEEIHPSQACIGDIAALPTEGPLGFSVGIVNGETILVRGLDCMSVAPLSAATRAFRVPMPKA